MPHQEFFRSDFFIEVGAVGLVHKIQAATQQVLGAVDLAATLTPADVEAVLLQQLGLLEEGFERGVDVWHAYLLPPGQQPVQLRSGEICTTGAPGAARAVPGSTPAASGHSMPPL